ncbi:MAG TPA: trypsin-like peptidase domain-containing protein [Chthonomonadaceae bacterium]|nr:trypsin-like peptidase domain-containing protein [Chthonomonadaceae bacterium]
MITWTVLSIRKSAAASLAAAMLLAACALHGRPALAQGEKRPDAAERDTRLQTVANTTQYPYSAICKVIATFPDETTVEGTGTMIGPHHCLTALHLLFDPRTKVAAKRVRVVPGYDDGRLLTKGLSSHPFGTTRMTQFLYWEPHDIAILVTADNIGHNSSWMTVGSRTDKELEGPTYLVGGYTTAPSGSERQSTLSALVTRVDGDRLTLNAEGARGLDGGPIFQRQAVGKAGEQDVWAIVGIQTGAGRGVRIPQEMKRILDRFLHDDFSGVNAKIPIPAK